MDLTGDFPMNEKKTADSAINNKKIWTAPVIQVIQLSSAANTTHTTTGDGYFTKKS
jgi:hypothetical protein